MYIDLALNLALLVALSVVSGFVSRYGASHARLGALIQGAIFGGTAIVGMLRPMVIEPGVIFDGRSIMISLCALFYGPWAGTVSGLMAMGFRIYLGGPGMITGLTVIFASAAIGAMAHYRQKSRGVPSTRMLYKFGLIVHLAMLALMVTLPAGNMAFVLKYIGPPIVLLYPLATVFAGNILANQQALRESEGRFQTMVDALYDWVWEVDLQGRYTYVNQRVKGILGYEPAEMIGKNTLEFMSEEEATRIRAIIDSLSKEPKPVVAYESINLHKDGHEVHLETSAIPFFAADGTCLGYRGVDRDITARKQAETQLLLKNAALNATADAIVITDSQGTIEWVNPAFTAMTGYEIQEVLGKNPRDLLRSGAHDEAFYKDMWDTILSGKVWRGEMTNRRKDGSLYPEQQTITPVKNAQGDIAHFIAIKRDITEEKRLEAQFVQAQKMEAIGRLAGGVAHDFNNMLSIIIGNAQMALIKLKPDDPLCEDLREIENAGNRSANLTRQLLAFARKQIIAPKILDLNDTVSNLLKMLRRLIGEHIALVWKPAESLWPVSIDPGQIDQILANLVINARDAISGAGKIVIETGNATLDEAYCQIHAGFLPGQYAMLAVSDDGCGMDRETMAHIFEPFFTTKPVGEGTGLGLATVYGIVKQNNGFINVYSEPGHGATFRIYLPRHVAPETANESQGRPAELPIGDETVLLVEDEIAVLNITRRLLERLGYTVLAASNPNEAVRLVQKYAGDIHLLLSDVIMPDMNGRDLWQHLKPMRPAMKCLFISGYTADIIAHKGVIDADVQFLQKPFSIQELAEKLREALSGAQR